MEMKEKTEYPDSSATVKRYVKESGSEWIRGLYRSLTSETLYWYSVYGTLERYFEYWIKHGDNSE